MTGPAGTCGCQGQCNHRWLIPSPGLPVSLSPTVSGLGHFQNFLFSFPGGGKARCEGLRGSERLEEGRVWNSLVLGEKETACQGSRCPRSHAAPASWGLWGPRQESITPVLPLKPGSLPPGRPLQEGYLSHLCLCRRLWQRRPPQRGGTGMAEAVPEGFWEEGASG